MFYENVPEFVDELQQGGPPHVLVVHHLLEVVFPPEVSRQSDKERQVIGVRGGRDLHDGFSLGGQEVLENNVTSVSWGLLV